jgi:hypothetical protein
VDATEPAPNSTDQVLSHRLSFPQEFFCSLDEGDQSGSFDPNFVLADGWRIRGPVDAEALQGALDDLVVRHELLRTVLDRGDGPRYQRIHPPCPVPFELVEHEPLPAPAREDLVERLMTEAEAMSVDVGKPPMLRAALHRFAPDDSLLLLVVHHLAADNWSIRVLFRDLAAGYAARTGAEHAPLPVPRQYREYTDWQHAEYARRDAAGAAQYWREKLGDARTFVLPKDPTAPGGPTPRYAMYSATIPAAEAARVSGYARRMRCSNFMVLISVFYVMAQRISGSGDITIRTLMANRDEVEFQDTLGPFLNLLPLRADITGCAGFDEVVRRVRSACLESYSMALPFQRLLEAVPELIAEETEPGKTPFLFEMVQSQIPGPEPLIGEAAVEVRRHREGVSPTADIPSGMLWNMDLLGSGELDLVVLFNLEEFEVETVVAQVQAYRRLLAESIPAPEPAAASERLAVQ